MIESAFMSLLIDDYDLADLVDDRVYYNTAPQDVEVPYIVLFKIAGPREHSHDGVSHLAHPRFQFSVFANTYLEAKQVTQAIQGILDCFQGESEGILIESCLYINEVDMYEPQTNLHHIASDYEIYHKED
jgi:hypothetical protein